MWKGEHALPRILLGHATADNFVDKFNDAMKDELAKADSDFNGWTQCKLIVF